MATNVIFTASVRDVLTGRWLGTVVGYQGAQRDFYVAYDTTDRPVQDGHHFPDPIQAQHAVAAAGSGAHGGTMER
jgi:hypothetical protein